jgi:hypothetical protein
MRPMDPEDQRRYYRELEQAMKRADRSGEPRRYPRRVVLRATTLAANLFGDGLRDVLDPRLRGSR